MKLEEEEYNLVLCHRAHYVNQVCMLYSVTGKKLMAKCRMLIQENQELGRQLSQGRVAQLEAELALQKKYSEELKASQDGKLLAWQ